MRRRATAVEGEHVGGWHSADLDLLFALFTTVLYAALLALLLLRHCMWRDEMQAWLIARDSTSIPALFHNLRYEGHPALWYLLLYFPSHASWNPVSMQVLNWVIAVVEAWLILSTRSLPRTVRLLAVFSLVMFFTYGVLARSYMLAALLLTIAVRMYCAGDRYRWAALAALALAINTHFLAIPIALSLWAVVAWRTRYQTTRPFDGKVLAEIAVLLVALSACYLTVRRPADSWTVFDTMQLSFGRAFLLDFGRLWARLLTVTESGHLARVCEQLAPAEHISIAACVLSIGLLGLFRIAMRCRWAFGFLVAATLLELAAFAATVRVPDPIHFGFLYLTIVFALMLDSSSPEATSPRPMLQKVAWWLLIIVILLPQSRRAVQRSLNEYRQDYSCAKATVHWLQQSGYAHNLWVVQPDYVGASLLGYAQRTSAYYPSIRGLGSFAIWRTRDEERAVTPEEMAALEHGAQLPVVIIANVSLTPEQLDRLRVQYLRSFTDAYAADEQFYVYVTSPRQ